jgi:hypothetical protein
VWYYRDAPLEDAPEEHLGFVYCITELDSGKKYIGKKLFWTKVKRKGKRVKVQTDWQKYYGSSLQLQEAVKEAGSDKYRRDILYLCKTKGEMSYRELKEQIDRGVLFSDDYYNQFVGCKIHANHVKGLKNEEL